MQSTTFPPEFHPLKQETNRAVLEAASAGGARLLLVGGYVRDALLHRYSGKVQPHDFDYMVIGRAAIEFGRELADKLAGHFVLLDQELDTCRVVLDSGMQIDLAGCLGGSLESDIKRRDLTINALAWDPQQPDDVLDLVGGIADLQVRKIRAVSEQGLLDDPLRMLRVFRFAAALNFDIDEQTLAFVTLHAGELKKSASERICYEMFAILDSPRAGAAIKGLAKTELLEIVFPELSACHQVTSNAYHHLGLFDHSLQTLIECERGYDSLPAWAQETFNVPLAHNISRLGATKLASLLHDIGKPATWVVRPDGKHTFIGHDKLGAEMISATAKRLKWAKPLERLVESLVRWHLRPGALFHQGPPTDRAVFRFYRDIGDELPQLILLALADFRSTCGPGLQEGRELLENQLVELLQNFVVYREGKKQAPKLLDGRDVMQLLGVESGPMIGELLDELEEARGLGEVSNKRQAETFVLERYKQKYSK